MNSSLPVDNDSNNSFGKSNLRIIIAYASAGSGHFRAAEAAYDYFKENCQNLGVKLIDALEYSNFLFRNIYKYGYELAVSLIPKLWGFGYWLTAFRNLQTVIRGIRFIVNRINSKKFTKLLIRENPDFIISTHFFSSEVSAYLKRNQKISSKLVTVITDFDVHPFWINSPTDFYIVGSGLTKRELIQKGVTADAIKVFGIPVNQKFLREYDKRFLCKKFIIEEDKFTILIVTGSFAIGPIERVVDLLFEDTQILVVCAKNKKLYKRLKNKNSPQVKIFGYIDNIQELMAVSQVIITKPGGLTIAEVLARELVPIFIAAISGQEEKNLNILKKYNIDLRLERIKDIRDTILDYKNHPERLDKIKGNLRKIKKPFAIQELYNFISKIAC